MNTNRREFLKRLAILPVAAGTAGCGALPGGDPTSVRTDLPGRSESSPDPESTPQQRTIEELALEWGFDGVVDLQEEGADATGSVSIDDILERHVGDDALVFLPRGRYLIDGTVGADGVDRVGIVGDRATLVPQDGNEDTILTFGWPDPVGSALLSGVTFDFNAVDTGGRPVQIAASDRLLIEDVAVSGEADVPQDLFRVDVTDPDGAGVVRRLYLPDGAPGDTKVTGCEVGDENHGELSFLDCEIDGFPDNGLYANPPEGTVNVIGGRYLNNGVAGVRIEVAEDAVIRGVHVRCDDAEGGGENMRGIRLRNGHSVLVEDCFVEMLEVTSSDGAITFSSELESATVRNTLIHVDADDVNALRFKNASTEAARAGPFVCEGITITGSAGEGAAIQASGRDNVTLRNICMYQPGFDRDGIHADDISGEFTDSHVSVTGYPFVVRDSSFPRRNVVVHEDTENPTTNTNGSCGSTVTESRFR